MKLHFWLAFPFGLLALLFGYIAYQLDGDKEQSFKDYWNFIKS